MSALDNLSVASNVLQVIGFADTVFRVGKNLYELFDKARSASRSIAWLLLELQALLKVVALVRVVIIEHASSPFAQDDGHTLPNVDIILTLIEQDFRHLRGLLNQTAGSGREGWLSLLQSNIRWALKDQEIVASRQRLAQYTQNLTVALTISGRRNDIALRTKLQSIEDRIQASAQSSLPPPLIPKVDTQPPSSGRTFRVSRKRARATWTVVQPRSSPQNNLVEANCTPTRLDHRKDIVITRGTVDFDNQNTAFTSYICPKIYVYEQADRSLFLDAGNYALHQITKPVVFLRDSLMESFDAACTNRTVSTYGIISEAQAKHLKLLFDFLVASAHMASVDSITKRYDNSSGIKLLSPDSSASKCNDAIIPKREIDSSSIAEISLPTYLEEKSMTLDTVAGSVKAKILSARSYMEATTLAFTFTYLGDVRLTLSPFAVRFMSHELVGCFHYGTGNVCERCLRRAQRLNSNYAFGHSHIELPDLVQYFLPPIATYMHDGAQLTHFVAQHIHQWRDVEMTIYMACGMNLPRIPVRVYEFSSKTGKVLTGLHYQLDPVTDEISPVVRRSPPLALIRIDHNDEERYNRHIDFIVYNYLNDFGEICWIEDDNDFQLKLFKLMTRVRPRTEDEDKLLHEVFRLIVVTYIMGHVICIAEETKESALSQMYSYTGPGTYAHRFCYPRLANRQIKYVFRRLHASILTALLNRLQKIFKASKGCDNWVCAFIAILGLAMAHEDEQKTIHLAMNSYSLMHGIDMQRGQMMADVACSDIDNGFSFTQQLFWWKYGRNYNPLRDAELDWDENAGFGDMDSVLFVRNVASLVKENVDFLRAREEVQISQKNLSKYTSRLVARFLLSFWLPR